MGRVLVVGSINMDVIARAPHHPAIGETVLGTHLRFAPGGKGANQAVAAARLGAVVEMVGRVGSDAFGDTLVGFLAQEGVGVGGVRRSAGAPSGTALIVVDGRSDNSIVVVPGANATVSVDDLDGPGSEVSSGDVVLAQYEIPLSVVRAALARGRRAGARTILNPSPSSATATEDLLDLADFVVVNEVELSFLASVAARSGEVPATAGEAAGLARVLRRRPDQVVIATLGHLGAVALIDAEVVVVEGHRVDAVDSTGAGDCFVGALAAALCREAGVAEAVRLANLAASISVQRVGAGTSMPTLAEVNSLAAD